MELNEFHVLLNYIIIFFSTTSYLNIQRRQRRTANKKTWLLYYHVSDCTTDSFRRQRKRTKKKYHLCKYRYMYRDANKWSRQIVVAMQEFIVFFLFFFFHCCQRDAFQYFHFVQVFAMSMSYCDMFLFRFVDDEFILSIRNAIADTNLFTSIGIPGCYRFQQRPWAFIILLANYDWPYTINLMNSIGTAFDIRAVYTQCVHVSYIRMYCALCSLASQAANVLIMFR